MLDRSVHVTFLVDVQAHGSAVDAGDLENVSFARIPVPIISIELISEQTEADFGDAFSHDTFAHA